MKRGKKYQDAAKLVDRSKLYDVDEAVALVKKVASAGFDETVECHIRTGCDGPMLISRSEGQSSFGRNRQEGSCPCVRKE